MSDDYYIARTHLSLFGGAEISSEANKDLAHLIMKTTEFFCDFFFFFFE